MTAKQGWQLKKPLIDGFYCFF